MKFKTIATIVITLFMVSTSYAFNSHKWMSNSKTSEMGESVFMAAILDSDPEVSAALCVARSENNPLVILIQTYNVKPNFSEYSLEFKIDENEILSYKSSKIDDPDGLATIPNTKLLNQLMTGDNVKVRFDTISKGVVVVDFSLNGSMEAIAQVLGSKI